MMQRRAMTRLGFLAAILAMASLLAFGVEKKHGVIVGEITRLDRAARTITVKAADGTEHVFRFVARTAVHGVQLAETGGRDVFHGLQTGMTVAVHHVEEGSVKTAEAVDHIGKDGLKGMEVTIREVGRKGSTAVLETARGTKETVHLTEHAARIVTKDIGEGTGKAVKGTVYYTEEGGRKVVHFFQRAI